MAKLLSEEEIIARLRQKDAQIMAYLYDHYAAALYGVVLRIVLSEVVAEDVMQEVFTKIWQNIDNFDTNKGRLYTWMVNVARNLAIDTTRSKEFKKTSKNRNIENNVHHLELQQTTTLKPELIGIQALVKNLSEEHQAIIDLVYFQGYTLADAAEELNVPLGTLKTRLRTALQLLRKLV